MNATQYEHSHNCNDDCRTIATMPVASTKATKLADTHTHSHNCTLTSKTPSSSLLDNGPALNYQQGKNNNPKETDGQRERENKRDEEMAHSPQLADSLVRQVTFVTCQKQLDIELQLMQSHITNIYLHARTDAFHKTSQH